MRNHKKEKQKGIRWHRVILLAVLLATLATLTFALWPTAAQTPTVHVVFSDGGYRGSIKDAYADTALFEDISMDATFTAAGCLIVPGTDFATTTAGRITASAADTIDPETFYFDPAGSVATRWAYSFTGWQVKGSTQRAPARTVFQPGDVITPDVLADLASQGLYTDHGDGTYTLELEAVWGKCYFIRNPFDKLLYAEHATYGWYPDFNESLIYAQGKGLNLDGAYSSDTNVGNDPDAPKATIDGLFSDLRSDIYTNKTQAADDAYAIVVMLVGDLDYYKDTNKGNVYYGYLSGADKNKAFISTTYKSRQAANDPATGYNYYLKQKQYSNTMYSNMRFDNINLLKFQSFYTVASPESKTSPGTVSTEFMLSRLNSSTFHYFEATARFCRSRPSGGAWAISTFRPADYDVVSLNGGSFGSWHTTYSSTIAKVNNKNRQLHWYMGRRVSLSSIVCGTTSNYDYTVHTLNVDMQLNITGGTVTTVYGGSAGFNSICVGAREINVYGNDSSTAGEYDPKITSLYGGADRARFFGDINVNLFHSHCVANLYGGGNAFSATTYGNITVLLDHSTVTNNLFGGGQNGNTEVVPEQYVQYAASGKEVSSSIKLTQTDLKVPAPVGSGGKVTIRIINGSTVRGNVYGSGMGSSQTISFSVGASNEAVPSKWYETNYYPTGWDQPLTTYPAYQQDTGYVLVGAVRRISWTEFSPNSINFYSDNTLAYLSLATVQDVEIEINGSTIGTAVGKTTGHVYGGGSIAKVLGNTVITVVDSRIYGNVYGGGDGSTQPSTVTLYRPLTGLASYKSPVYTITALNSDTKYPSKMTITSQTPSSYSQNAYKYATAFSWSGETYLLSEPYNGIDLENYLIYSPNTEGLGSVIGNTAVTVDGASTRIYGAVYGGGNMGIVGGSTNVLVKNGTVNEIYAGCDSANVQGDTHLEIQGGTVTSAYGGNNQNGLIMGEVSVLVTGGNLTSVLGGGNLADYNGAVTLTVSGGRVGTLFGGGKEAAVNETAVNILGNAQIESAYGGGDRGPVQSDCAITVSETAQVQMLYGGANAADIDGDVTLTFLGGSVTGELFGANNQSGLISGAVHVLVSGGNTETLYGGGNHADYSGTVVVTLNSGRFGMIYGGGKAAAVEATELTAGAITVSGSLYGGGYQGDVLTNTSVLLENASIAGGLYGGGYNGDVAGNTSIVLSRCTLQGSAYGGGYQGDVLGSTDVDVLAAEIEGNLYGGGYAGTVGGTGVSVDDTTFGAGTILIHGSVFGGGEGSTATVFGSTEVDVNMALDFVATEVSSDTDSETPSGASSTDVQIITPNYSKILGNVFGGGDLGQVGDGRIIQSSNTAQVSIEGLATVTIRNGYIGESVFGGGSGVPKDGQVYNVKMGTVFGSTRTNVYGGYIEGSVYGGGTQSRVYAVDGTVLAACVSIDQTQPDSAQKILIGGSVFSGGDRGTGATQNASVPTTIGNVEVRITGAPGDVASDIYFLRGGIYGDGNLCLVRGSRVINITDYHTNEQNTLKTFYSLQRADIVNLDNSRVVLLGAIDLVEMGDPTVYSINRVGKIYMENGSTVKLDQIVKYLGALESSVDPGRVFVDRGNNGSNGYENHGGESVNTNPLTEQEILDYQDLADEKNTICVANGLYLRIESEQTQAFGSVNGLFSLSLLRAKAGEGGGFVYASIPLSTGAFICETYMDGAKHYNEDETPTEVEFDRGIYYVEQGGSFVRAEGEYQSGTTYYTKNYMKVIGDVGGFSSGSYTYYYWYINGATIQYTTSITGYIGSMETRYGESSTIPPHAKELHYVLHSLEGNDFFENAIKGANPTYELLKSVSFDGEGMPVLTGQQIAIEVRLGEISLGFVWYNESTDTWYLCQSTKDFEGYNERKAQIENNVLINAPISIETLNANIELVLYKSTEVNAELSEMTLDLTIDIYFDNGEGIPGNVYNEGASKLKFHLNLAIERLMPEQTLFYQPGESYGVASTIEISITGQSSFTAQYKTRYIPTAFPATGGMGMRWVLSTTSYYYYMDSAENYLTVDESGECVNISSHLLYDFSIDVSTLSFETYPMQTVLKRADGSYFYKANDGEGVTRLYEFELVQAMESPMLPKGTKITMIDISPGINPTFYYYFCITDTEAIDVMDFSLMGSTQSIRESGNKPSFMTLYADEYGKQLSSRITEEILFIFDFSAADWGTDTLRDCMIEFKHFYGNSTSSMDIMDYVFIRKEPVRESVRRFALPTPFLVYPDSNGLDEFSVEITQRGSAVHPEYYDLDTLNLNLNIVENFDRVNTMLSEESYVLRLSLVNGGVEKKLPAGIRVEVDGSYFYPAPGNLYVLIRVESSGEHSITIESYLTSMREAFGVDLGEEVSLQFELYCAQYDESSHALTISGVVQANTITVDSYQIRKAPVYAMRVEVEPEGRFLQASEYFRFNFTTSVSGNEINAARPAVVVSKKSAETGKYEAIAINELFFTDTTMTSNGVYEWRISRRAERGTYRLTFTYGDRVEYLTLVVE